MSGKQKEVVFVKKVRMNLIRVDGGTQMRVEGLDQAVVDEYAEKVEELPAGKACWDGAHYWLYDGNHTHAAHQKAGKIEMTLAVVDGDVNEARRRALGVNADHGQPRTAATKRNVVAIALESYPKMSDRSIAELCNVSNHLVARVKSDKLLQQVKDHDKAEAASSPGGRNPSCNNQSAWAGTNTPSSQSGNLSTSKPAGASKTTPAATSPATCDPDDEEPGAEAQAAQATEPAAPAPSLDQVGRTLPGDAPAIIDAFACLPQFRSLLKRISDLKAELDRLAEGPAGRWVAVELKSFDAHVGNLHRDLRHCIPYAVCPSCGGRKCSACKNTGYMPEDVYKRVPEDVRGPLPKNGVAA